MINNGLKGKNGCYF